MSRGLLDRQARFLNRRLAAIASKRAQPWHTTLADYMEDMTPGKGFTVDMLPNMKTIIPTVGICLPDLQKIYLDPDILGIKKFSDFDPSKDSHVKKLMAFFGVFYHESWGHGIHTKVIPDPKLCATKSAQIYWTLFEEFRIEHHAINDLPESQECLETMAVHFVFADPTTKHSKVTASGSSSPDFEVPAGTSPITVLFLGLGRVLGGTITHRKTMKEIVDFCESKFEEDELRKSLEVFARVLDLDDTDFDGLNQAANDLVDILGDPFDRDLSDPNDIQSIGQGAGGGGSFDPSFMDDLEEAEQQRGVAGSDMSKRLKDCVDMYIVEVQEINAADIERKLKLREELRRHKVMTTAKAPEPSLSPPGRIRGKAAMQQNAYFAQGRFPPKGIKPFMHHGYSTKVAPNMRVSFVLDTSGSMASQQHLISRVLYSMFEALRLEGNQCMATGFAHEAQFILGLNEPAVTPVHIDSHQGSGHYAGDACALINKVHHMVAPRGDSKAMVIFLSDLELVQHEQQELFRDYCRRWRTDGVILGAFAFSHICDSNRQYMDVIYENAKNAFEAVDFTEQLIERCRNL